jgi:hypothetical protein
MGRKDHERAQNSRRLTTTPMLDAERKASPFCIGRAIVVNEPEESAGPDVVS